MSADYTTLLNGRVKLIQTKDGLRASTDSVLLAAAVTASECDNILDMGCGTGSVGLCINERLKDLKLSITGIDIQDKMILLAERNAKENNLKNEGKYISGDIQNKSLFKAEAFDHIVMNPPYYCEGERQKSNDPTREIAYSGELQNWIGSALHWVKQGGSLTVIHRADRLDKILTLVHGKFGAITIWPIYSKPNEPAIRIIVKMIRNRKTPLTLRPPIILYNENGQATNHSYDLLRKGKAL